LLPQPRAVRGLDSICGQRLRDPRRDRGQRPPDISYKSGETLTGHETTRCQLDLYVPAPAKDLPCLVWFHGGGLIKGDKGGANTAAVAHALAGEGLVVAAANYRLSPGVKYPSYLEDAAAVVAWVQTRNGRPAGCLAN